MIAVIFLGHYVLSFSFSNIHVGTIMVWTSFIVGGVMIFMLAGLGGKDIVNMAKDNKAAIKAQKEKAGN